MKSKVCLHLLADNATTLNRVSKEAASFLRTGRADRVVLAAKWDPGLPEVQELAPDISICRVKLATRHLPRCMPWQIFKELEWRHRVVRLARRLQPHTVICHSVLPLRTAVCAQRETGAALIYDAHELETERIDLKGLQKRMFAYVERSCLPQCGAVICVSDSIADWYAQHYGIIRPAVVRNIPDVRTQKPFTASRALRERFGFSDDAIVFIYSGALVGGRRIEQLIRVFRRLPPDRHLVCMGYGPLQGLVKEAADTLPNVHFLPAVPTNQILQFTSGAEVGIVGVDNACLSYYLSLPNKVFEYLLAGTPALVPDYPEMRRLIHEHGCGWVVQDADEYWQRCIGSLTRKAIMEARTKARAAIRSYSWEAEEAALFAAHMEAVRAAQNHTSLFRAHAATTDAA
jgi:glycosyltransferase involved in cell wall biosynthesis